MAKKIVSEEGLEYPHPGRFVDAVASSCLGMSDELAAIRIDAALAGLRKEIAARHEKLEELENEREACAQTDYEDEE